MVELLLDNTYTEEYTGKSVKMVSQYGIYFVGDNGKRYLQGGCVSTSNMFNSFQERHQHLIT